jgi:hypothetical protein
MYALKEKNILLLAFSFDLYYSFSVASSFDPLFFSLRPCVLQHPEEHGGKYISDKIINTLAFDLALPTGQRALSNMKVPTQNARGNF